MATEDTSEGMSTKMAQYSFFVVRETLDAYS